MAQRVWTGGKGLTKAIHSSWVQTWQIIVIFYMELQEYRLAHMTEDSVFQIHEAKHNINF
jgi:hypothetical protein